MFYLVIQLLLVILLMMIPAYYNLCYTQFDKRTSESFRRFRSDKAFCDVTLVSEDGMQASAHKLILGAASDFFRNTLLRNPHQHPLIFLKGARFRLLEAIIEFIYLGETAVEENNLDIFLDLCKSLEIKGLEDSEKIFNAGTNEEDKTITTDTVEMESQGFFMFAENDQNEKAEKRLSIDQNITRVQEICDGKKKSKYVCNLCEYETSQITNARVHIDTKHEKKKFSCSECDKECNSVSALAYHKKSKHDGFRIVCTFCDTTFTSPQGLKVHLTNVHT